MRDGAYFIPEGRLSCDEVEALENMCGLPAMRLPHNPSHSAAHAQQESPINLDMSAFSGGSPDEDQIRLCLDFGTAVSKAWATGLDESQPFPLVLGVAAGEGEKLGLPSTVFISNSGHIYFGEAAERQHRQELRDRRQMFENIKRLLSEEEIGTVLDDVALSPAIDPTNSGLSKGDMLLLYLSWLTDMSLISLSNLLIDQEIAFRRDDAKIRCVKRRFAIPCFEDAQHERSGSTRRAEWARELMETAILRAQIVADTLHGKWQTLSTNEVRAILYEVKAFELTPLRDILFANICSVKEPIAAGASRFEDELDQNNLVSGRRLLLVVDSGAGTTDFAAFQVFSKDDRPARFALVAPTVRMCLIAGNAIDEILRPLVLQACGIDPASGSPRSEDDFAFIKNDLGSQIREIKHSLIEGNIADIALVANTRGELKICDLLSDSRYKDFGGQLLDVRRSIIERAYSQTVLETMRLQDSIGVVHVLLTGGSSKLPIIQSLAEGEANIGGVRFQFRRVTELPGWIGRLPRNVARLLEATYPQSAVSIGGSAPQLPDTIPDLSAPIAPPTPGPRILERYQVTGVG